MTPDDLERLIKVLGLTTSDQDGEALSAIRRANEILKRGGTTWAQLLGAQSIFKTAEQCQAEREAEMQRQAEEAPTPGLSPEAAQRIVDEVMKRVNPNANFFQHIYPWK